MFNLRGLIFGIGLFSTAIVGSCVLMAPTLPLLFIPHPFPRKMYRKWNCLIAACWFSASCFSLERWCGIKLKFCGDDLPFGENCLIISNHRTRIDWMFFWCLCLRYGQLTRLKIVLKDALKSIPGFGWAMQMFLFLFLRRNDRQRDLEHIRHLLQYSVDYDEPPTLLLFPEGTNISPNNLERSHAYAEKKGLTKYNYVLHPKVSGWVESIKKLRPCLDAVYDITIAYVDYLPGERPSEKSMFKGRFPKEVHFLLARHTIDTIPMETEQLQQWLKDSFDLKENQLHYFYNHDNRFQCQEMSDGGDADDHTDGVHQTEGSVMHKYISRIFSLTVSFWTATCILFVYGMIFSTWVRIYLLVICTVFVLLTRLAGGIDMIELYIHSKKPLQKDKIQ